MIESKVDKDRQSLPTRGIKGSPTIWLQQKRARDSELLGVDISKYWVIENKMYDLEAFADSHPGGKSWITLTKGQDVTPLFIIHHLNEEKARKALEKYYVGQTKNELARFSFEENGLYRTVRRQVLKKMSIQEIQDESQSKRHAYIIFGLLLMVISLIAISIHVARDSWYPFIFSALCSIPLIGMIGIGHNFIHHRENNFKYFYVITGFTHNEWQIMHCLSHHIYPNLELDYEAAALEPIGFFLRSKPENMVFTELVVVMLFVLIQPTNFLLKLFFVPLVKRKVPDFWYLCPLVMFLTFYMVSGDAWYALKLHIFLYGFYGLLLNRIIFCGHRLQELLTEGSERVQDFGEHTILSTNDTDTWIHGIFSYILLAGFNVHTPHHFFPTADLAALPKIFDIIKETCKKMGIKRFETNRVSCFASLSKGIIKRLPFIRK